MHKHFPHWRAYREFGGGGGHRLGRPPSGHRPVGLGMDDSGPVEVLPPPKPGDKRGAKLVYANGVTVEHKDGFGVDFFGTEGEVQVNRGTVHLPARRRGDRLPRRDKDRKTSCAAEVQKAERAFLRTRRSSSTSARTTSAISWNAWRRARSPSPANRWAARSAICCHLMNLAYYHGRKFKWDPANFTFVDGTGDPAVAHPRLPQPVERVARQIAAEFGRIAAARPMSPETILRQLATIQMGDTLLDTPTAGSWRFAGCPGACPNRPASWQPRSSTCRTGSPPPAPVGKTPSPAPGPSGKRGPQGREPRSPG